jgi:hypothetical protein
LDAFTAIVGVDPAAVAVPKFVFVLGFAAVTVLVPVVVTVAVTVCVPVCDAVVDAVPLALHVPVPVSIEVATAATKASPVPAYRMSVLWRAFVTLLSVVGT